MAHAHLPRPEHDVPKTFAQMVTFVWDDRGQRTAQCEMPWRPNWSVKHYLREQPLRAYPLLAMWKRCKTVNRDKVKVRLTYVPPPGDAIVISRS